MSNDPLFVGLDIGTSGARAIVIDTQGHIISDGQCAMADIGNNHRDPNVWLTAAKSALNIAFDKVNKKNIRSISVDGTSGTMIPIDNNGRPLSHGCMYNDPCTDDSILGLISKHAPRTSASHGATSGLARAISFQNSTDANLIVHQADWIAGQFCDVYSSDENNALKTGYDPVRGKWPDWIEKTGMDLKLLPTVHEAGATYSQISKDFAHDFGLSSSVQIVAGTTDGCASFVATGASEIGDGVTALGTTLTLKILSDRPIFSPEDGIYSHRILGNWLAGGASNTGGNVLLEHFNTDQISELSKQIDPEIDSELDYYPLSKPGERFPISDANLCPRMSPRPKGDSEFLKGIFQGMAAIEWLGYDRLAKLGGPKLSSIRTVGGGAKNPVWARMRERKIDVPFIVPLSDQAAFGTALLARRGYLT